MRNRLAILTTTLILLSSYGDLFSQRRARSDSIVLREGTNLQVRLSQRLDSDMNRTGDTFQAIVDQDLIVDGRVQIPEGTLVTGKLPEVRDSGRIQGRARMSLTLTEVKVRETVFPIRTNTITVEAEGGTKRDVGVIGGSTILGAIIGAIAGGKQGAAVGAVIGAAGGTGAVLTMEGKDVEFEPEQKFNFIVESSGRIDSTSSTTLRRETYTPAGSSRLSDAQIDEIAASLNTNTEWFWNNVRPRLEDRYRAAPRGQGNLYFALGNFAHKVNQFAHDAANSDDNPNLRRAARSLITQAEDIDRMMGRGTRGVQIREEWRFVQADVDRLAEAFNLNYASGDVVTRGPGSPRVTELPRRDEGYFRWQGKVDGLDYIRLQGDRVTIRHVQFNRIVDASYDLRSPLPRYPVTVHLTKMRGRGRVELTEQPSASNNYTAVVFIEDEEGGEMFVRQLGFWVGTQRVAERLAVVGAIMPMLGMLGKPHFS